MKRTIAILMAVLMLTALCTACSGTLGMGDGRAYGNVSTTPNGYVNGGDGYGYYGGNQNSNSGTNGSRNGYSHGSAYGNNDSYRSNAGTGMTGGR